MAAIQMHFLVRPINTQRQCSVDIRAEKRPQKTCLNIYFVRLFALRWLCYNEQLKERNMNVAREEKNRATSRTTASCAVRIRSRRKKETTHAHTHNDRFAVFLFVQCA